MRRRAFTLFEVLVALSIAIALLAAVVGFFWTLGESRARLVERMERSRALALAQDRLESALFVTIAGGGAPGPGVRGEATSIELLVRDVAPQRIAEGAAAALGDLRRVRIAFENGRFVVGDDAATAELDAVFHDVRFRYHDGGGWQDSFDSVAAGRLPAAVELAVWFEDPSGEEDEEEVVDPEQAAPLDRATFDAEAGFDEFEFATRGDRGPFGPPPPDRVRVFVVPDAGPDETGSNEVGEDDAGAPAPAGSAP